MPTQFRNIMPAGCGRRAQLQSYVGRRRHRPIRKSRRCLNPDGPTKPGSSALADAVLQDVWEPPPAPEKQQVTDSIDFELMDLMSSNSAGTGRKDNGTSEESTGQTSKHIDTDKECHRLLIEGDKAILVNVNPWPKRPHLSALDDYKKPNPKLTAAEIRRQKANVAERRQLNYERRKELERQRRKNSIYCLPKRLIQESRARLAYWYKLPHEEYDLTDESQDEEEGH